MAPEVGNLHTVADGIFGTHVTWNDIEHDMQLALHTKATFGSEKTIKNIGDGNGFLSKICLIEPKWQNKEAGEELPDKFIAKLCTAVTMVAFSRKMAEDKGIPDFLSDDLVNVFDTQVRTFHNNEVHVYHLLQTYNVNKVPRAKIFHSRKFTDENPLKGMILMEFMDNLKPVHIYNSVEPNTLHDALRAIAALEALTTQLTEEEIAGFSRKPLTEIFGTFFTEDIVEQMGPFLRGFGGAKMQPLIEDMLKIMPELLDTQWMDAVPDKLDMTRVLCHGDLWSTNVLWHEKDGKQSIAAMIDFQTAHLGNPAGDISRLLTTNLSGADRKAHEEELLETFYGYLKEELGDSPLPYTLNQLKEAYKRYQPIAGFLVVPMLGALVEQHLNNMNEEDKKIANDILEAKMEVLIKDVLDMHARNKEIRKTEKV